jgi:signal transduction histidine kinase
LAAGIAHEINTPTQYIGDNARFLKDSFADLLTCLRANQALLAAAKSGPAPDRVIREAEEAERRADLGYLLEEIPKSIDQSLEGISRVTSIVRAMKEFAHPDTSDKTLANINRAIESTVSVTRHEWKYVSDVNLDLTPDLPLVPCLLGDISQVLLNLIVNAAHAIEAKKNGQKGAITIRTKRVGEWVEIRIEDTGTGIPESIRDKIFDPFFTTKEVGKGTGQGLAITRSVIAKKHGGTIAFESEVGKGTTFIVRLPLDPQAVATAK